jgi:CobQ/CobB/MinD/ParA nucleotide binding domain
MPVSTEGNKNLSSNPRAPEPTPHRIVTFYSYKGGVGRSMAVANIAFLLARDHGLRVLVVDWDLEAPGLHRFFNMSEADLGEGVIDYLDKYKTLVRSPKRDIKPEDLSIKRYLREIYNFSGGGSLNLLGAGSQQTKAKYVEKVRGFDWTNFYREWNGAQVIEALRNEMLELADVTLIDSRTGITDVGGVCTVQLPDTVVFVFVFNEQNLTGVEQVASELDYDKNPSLEALHRRPELLFLPCRKELSELERLREWESRAAARFARFCDTTKIRAAFGDTETYLRKASVPYVPYFAYGEELAAKSKKGVELAEAFEPLIGLLLGEDSERSRARAQSKWKRIRRRALITSAGVIALSAMLVVVSFLLERGRVEFLSLGWLSLMRGAVGGILGSSFYSLNRFQQLSEEDPWRLGSLHLFRTLCVDLIGGCIVGLTTRVYLGPNRYYLISSIAAGLLWRPIVERAGGRLMAEVSRTSK